MIRILQVVGTMDFGGVETLLMSIYRGIDREKIQFDFLCQNRTDSKFSEEIEKLGGRMYKVEGPSHVGFIKYLNDLYSFFKSYPEYQIIHCHKSADNGLILWQAKRANIPIRISHSHIADYKMPFPFSLYLKLAKYLNNVCLTDAFACSNDAGKDLFLKKVKFTVLSNAININNFTYSLKAREKVRNSLNISTDCILFGHAGRFSTQKNHLFLLDVFREIHRIHENAKLILIGAGELEEAIQNKIKENDLSDYVIMGGQHSNMGEMYSAMDCFLFPSKYEGLGIVAVEAQCSGLPVIASKTVPKEAKITERMEFVSLDDPVEMWAERSWQAAQNCKTDREKYSAVVADSPYNIKRTTKYLQDFYLTRAEKLEKRK